MFRRTQIKPATQIDDRHDAAAQIHHAVDESRRLRQPRETLGRSRNLSDRGDRNAVILIAEAENDELLVCHGSRFSLHIGFAGRLFGNDTANELRPEQPVGRKQRDQSPAIVEAADRHDLRIALAAGEQSRRRIDSYRDRGAESPGWRPRQNRPRLRRSTRRRPCRAALRIDHRPAIPAMRATTPAAAGGPCSVTTPSTAVSGRGSSGDLIRQRNDLPHPVERQRVFLLAEIEAQQRYLGPGRGCGGGAAHRERRRACGGSRG